MKFEDTTANLWKLREEVAEGGPSKVNSRDSLFGERIIEDNKEFSASFYTERNPADQAPPQSFQPFSLDDFQPPSPLELPTNPRWTNKNDILPEPSAPEQRPCERIWLK